MSQVPEKGKPALELEIPPKRLCLGVLLYGSWAALWIGLSDVVVDAMFAGSPWHERVGALQGWGFVVLGGGLLCAWLRWQRRARDHRELEGLVEERSRQAAEACARAEAAQRAKSAFLANMSHEIRTPLNAIIGLSELLRRADPRPDQTPRLEQVTLAGRHLLALVDDLLDLSKIEAGTLRTEAADFHLPALLEEVCALVAEPARDKGLVLEIDAAGVPAWVHGDPARLRQALLSYAVNAVKFTQRGFVSIRARLVDELDGLLLRFEVQDSGIGIEPQRQQGLFGAFEQVDSSTTRVYGGTGLGLVLTQRLARLMGGDVGLRSAPGVGSTFWFTVRLRRAQAAPVAEPPSEEDAAQALGARHAGVRVLLVEDNPVNREVATAMLEVVGLSVDCAADGLEAVDKARAGRYALVLMDLQMPRMDGLDATRALRALPGWGEVPVLALTANASEEDREACLAAGMNGFIPKPVETATLYRVLLQGLERKEAAGPA
jgi:signal transduction histidine kinase/ActR/RegA family two-component response regulator